GAPDVRARAVWALGQVQDAAAVPALEQVLHDGAPEVRGRAAWALGTIAPAKAPSGLVAALSDGAPEVRMRAAWALGQIGDSSAAARLAVAIRDSSAEVRKAAMWAVGQVGGDAAQAVLIEALNDKDPEIRARAARSLSGSHADPWPRPWPIPILRLLPSIRAPCPGALSVFRQVLDIPHRVLNIQHSAEISAVFILDGGNRSMTRKLATLAILAFVGGLSDGGWHVRSAA